MQIYISRNGNQTGPFSEEQTRSMISAGMLSGDDLAWGEGFSNWQPLRHIINLPQPPPVPKTHVSTIAAPKELAVKEMKGVAGWLLFFCITLVMIGPLSSFGTMLKSWELSVPAFASYPSLKTVLVFSIVSSSAILLYGMIVGSLIWSGGSNGRKLAKQFLTVRLCATLAIEFICLLMMTELPKEVITAGINGLLGVIIREGIYFGVWWFYFKLSKRVMNTYGVEDH